MAENWTKPSTRTEIIDQLVEGVDRYNPQNVGILEDYLYHQIREREYDCLPNLAILKLYQFNPDLYNPDVVINILIKALTAAPAPDFNLCLALLGERQACTNIPLPDGEPDPLRPLLPNLIQLSNLLHTCRFPDFWKTYLSQELAPLRENYTVECAGFDDSVRDAVIRAVQATFTNIGRDRFATYVNLQGADFESYVASLGWSLNTSTGVVSVPPNIDNQIKATVTRETITLPQLQKIVGHSAKA
ncbi:armadillo-type protein [Cantharellus anzutake]|uniref:armadillo-type protein n=1 Tax=Cantharellus anzutake TaxID=1750568 RepID=UPI001906AEC0|nr:armadillo-type protein [Cantharellus anzutake]KAF8311030.1 armadillo-type protein [Cantharellus anzutake]